MIQYEKNVDYKFLFEEKKVRIESLQTKLEAMQLLYTFKERKEREKTKKELIQEKQNLVQLINYIDVCTTFKMNDFLPFITSYLSSIKQTDIIALPIKQDYEIEENNKKAGNRLARILSYRYTKQKKYIKELLYLDLNEMFYLVCSREEAETIQKMVTQCSLFQALEKMPCKDYLLLPMGFQEIHLAYGIELKKEWQTCDAMYSLFARMLEYAQRCNKITLNREDRLKKNGLELNNILQEIKDTSFSKNRNSC